MLVLYVVPLVALFSVGTAAQKPQNCEDLVKLLALEDHCTKCFSDNEILNEILRMTKSSWNSILPTSHNETILLKQGNLMDGKCFNSSLKMTYSKNRFLVTENNVTSSGYLLQTCPDCLTMQFTTTMTSVNFRSLYIFGKNKTPPESDLKYFRKQAECLQYPEPAQYSYNGVSELCSEPADGLQHPECSVTLSWWLDS